MGDSRPIWHWLSNEWAPVVLGGAILAWGLWRGNWRVLAVAVAAVGLTDPLCSYGLKPLAGRERPCRAVDRVHVIERLGHDACGSGPSMPSNHAANSAALAVALASPPLAAISVASGVSRVVAGQHWPSDVIVGWAVGGALGALVRVGARKGLGWT